MSLRVSNSVSTNTSPEFEIEPFLTSFNPIPRVQKLCFGVKSGFVNESATIFSVGM